MCHRCGKYSYCRRRKLYKGILFSVIAFVILVLFIVLVIWLVLRPAKPKFYLQDATFLAFNRSGISGNILTTTIQVTISTRNPNDRIGIYYDKLDVYAAYKYQRITLATATLPSYQDHNDVAIWSPFLYGVNVPIAPYLAMSLGQDQNAGVMLIHIKMDGRLRWKVGTWISGHYHIFITCPALVTCYNSNSEDSAGGYYSPVIKFQQVSTCSVDI